MKLVTKNELIHGEHYFIERISKRSNKIIWKARGNYSKHNSLYKAVKTLRESNEVFAFVNPHVYTINEYSKTGTFEWKTDVFPRIYIHDYNESIEHDQPGYSYRFYHSEKEAIIQNSLMRNMSVAMKQTLSEFITDINAIHVISDSFFPLVNYSA